MITKFNNVVVEAETLFAVYEYVKSYLDDTEKDLAWYKDEYKEFQEKGLNVPEWVTDGIAIEVKRKQVLLTTISKLYEQLDER